MLKTDVPICTQTKIPAKNRKYFKSVVDLGNHWLKVYVEGYDYLREPSWFSKCLYNTSEKLPGHVHYLSGSREDLKDSCWLVGNQAIRSGSSDLMRLVDDYGAKSSLWLEFFLGTLAHLPRINSQMELEIYATTNDVKRHQDIIKANEGVHKVRLQGIECRISIKIKKILPEGIAALKSQQLEGAVTICDIGGGNTSISRFFNSEPVGEPMVKDFGAQYLIDRLAANSDLKSLINQSPSKVILNYSLEKGLQGSRKNPAIYYGESSLNFYEIYKRELTDFIDCRLREVLKQLKRYLLGGDKILVIGGGSKLPLLSAALEKQGFLISSNGAFDNLVGLVSEVCK